MKTASHRLRVWYLTVGIAALFCTCLHTAALLTSFDSHPGYFRTSSLTILLYVCLAVSLLVCFSLPLFIKKGLLPTAVTAPTLPSTIATGLCALLFLVNFIGGCFIRDDLRLPPLLWFLGLLFLLIGTFCFTLRFLAEKPPLHLTLLTGYCAIFSLALLLCFTYFDHFTPMNAPHKVGLHLTLLSLMVYQLYELRTLAGEAMPRAAAVSAAAAFVLSVTVGVSNLIAFAMGVYDSMPYLMQDLLLVGFAAYIGTRAVTTAKRDLKVLADTEDQVAPLS